MKKRRIALLLTLLMLAGCAPETPEIPEPDPQPPAEDPVPAPEPDPTPAPDPEPEPIPAPVYGPEDELPETDWSVLLTHETGTAGPALAETPRWFTGTTELYEYMNWSEQDGVHSSFFVGYPRFNMLKDKTLESQINRAIQDRVDDWMLTALTAGELDAMLAAYPGAEAADAWFSLYSTVNLVGSLLSVELVRDEQVSFRNADGMWLENRVVHSESWYLCMDLATGKRLSSITELFDETVDVGALLNGWMAEQLAARTGAGELKRPFRGLPANFSDFFVNMTGLAITLDTGNPLTIYRESFYMPLWDLAGHMPALARNSGDYIYSAEPIRLYLMNNGALEAETVQIELPFTIGSGIRLRSGADQAVLDGINAQLEALEASVIDCSILPEELQNFARHEKTWGSFDGWTQGYGDLITVQYSLYMNLEGQYRTQYYSLTFDRVTGQRITAADLLNEAGVEFIRTNHAWMADEIIHCPEIAVTWYGYLDIYCNYDLQYRFFEFDPEYVDLDRLFSEEGIQ